MDRPNGKPIEAAIIQRATLFNLILADLYGPQRLLREGLFPPELVFPNPAFLRPCWESSRREAFTCTPTPPIWRARPTGNGG